MFFQRDANTPIRNILVVEDNPADVRLLRFALDQMTSRCALHVIDNGAQAIEYLFETPDGMPRRLDLILLDLNIPLINGHAVLEKIKQDMRTKAIPVIVMSSSQSTEDVNRAYRAYANCYISKPTSLDDYLGMVRMLEAFWLQVASLPTCA